MKIGLKISLFVLVLGSLNNSLFGQWLQYGQSINGDASYEYYGRAMTLSADGKILAIGSQANPENIFVSFVRTYQFVDNLWVSIGGDIIANDGDNSDAIAMNNSGNIIAIGSIRDGVIDGQSNPNGHVRIFGFEGGEWVAMGNEIQGSGGENAGADVALSADGLTLIIGARSNDENGLDAGQIRVYKFINDDWVQVGASIDGDSAIDNFGLSVDISADGSVISVGAPFNNNSSGQVKVYQEVNGEWQQMGTTIEGEINDVLGYSVSLSPDAKYLAVSCIEDISANAGFVKVFQFIDDEWVPIGSPIVGDQINSLFGVVVSLSSEGKRVAVGGMNNNSNGAESGFVQVYENVLGTWVQVDDDIVGESSEDYCGNKVTISNSGEYVAVSSFANDDSGFQAGHVRVFENINIVSTLLIDNSEFEVFPNPFDTEVVLRGLEERNYPIVIYNILGQQFAQEVLDVSVEEIKINTTSLPRGVYYIKSGPVTKIIIKE